MSQAIRMIVGLGNPGEEYANTRHNMGFLLIQTFLSKLPKNFERQHGCRSTYWRGAYAGKPLFLQMPETYMNLSGEAVKGLARANGITPEEILVAYDDMDLPLGRLRIRKNGSSGGHNGIKSIIEHLGTESFPRIRLGIGKMANGHGSADFVLSKFSEEESVLCKEVLERASDALVLCLRRDLETAMNRFNAKAREPESAGNKVEKSTNNIQNTPEV